MKKFHILCYIICALCANSFAQTGRYKIINRDEIIENITKQLFKTVQLKGDSTGELKKELYPILQEQFRQLFSSETPFYLEICDTNIVYYNKFNDVSKNTPVVEMQSLNRRTWSIKVLDSPVIYVGNSTETPPQQEMVQELKKKGKYYYYRQFRMEKVTAADESR